MIWQKNEQGTGSETRQAASARLPTDHTNTSHQSNTNNKTSAPRTPKPSHSHTTLRTRLNIPRARNAQHIPLCSLRPAGFARRLLPLRPTRRAHGAGRHPRTVPRGHDGVPSTRHRCDGARPTLTAQRPQVAVLSHTRTTPRTPSTRHGAPTRSSW